MQRKLETQGANVTIDDLGGVTFVDPSTTTLYDSSSQTNPYSLDELRESTDIQVAIDAGDIVIKDQNDNVHETILGIVNLANLNENNFFVINELSDFPSASGGKITLLSNTKYLITGSINIGTNYLELGNNTIIEGESAFISQIIYTGTGGAIRSTDNTISINSITGVASNASGKMFDVSDSTGTKNFILQQTIIANTTEIGSVDGFSTVLLDVINNIHNSSGWSFTDIYNIFVLE